MSMMEYSRSFELTMKESVKRVTHCPAAYYHTSRKSWYPKPEETIPFSKGPSIKPLPIVDMSKANCRKSGQCARRRQWPGMALYPSLSISDTASVLNDLLMSLLKRLAKMS